VNLAFTGRRFQHIPQVFHEEIAQQRLDSIKIETPDVHAVAVLQVGRHPLRGRHGDAELREQADQLLAAFELPRRAPDQLEHLPRTAIRRPRFGRRVDDPDLFQRCAVLARVAQRHFSAK
jgi:hypothetical protein